MGDSNTLADLKAAMDTILTDLFTIKNDMTTMKGRLESPLYGCQSAAIREAQIWWLSQRQRHGEVCV